MKKPRYDQRNAVQNTDPIYCVGYLHVNKHTPPYSQLMKVLYQIQYLVNHDGEYQEAPQEIHNIVPPSMIWMQPDTHRLNDLVYVTPTIQKKKM
mmetsp:Transcript_50645/g.93005  ORF Transcript_50645/g.93005 Transcript_50645/m.93005 type:complete len:94 (+) Transcript_50645:26-307(+)